MDWLKQWNEALDDLEDHLDGGIDVERMARTAGCSAYHFQRMFSYLAGIPLSEYIRRRRTCAGGTRCWTWLSGTAMSLPPPSIGPFRTFTVFRPPPPGRRARN